MTHRIICNIPTVYQYQSLLRFNLNIKANGNGSYTGTMEFYSKQDTKDYLRNRAEMYYDEFEGQVDEYIKDIEDYGILTIDAATARVEEIYEEE